MPKGQEVTHIQTRNQEFHEKAGTFDLFMATSRRLRSEYKVPFAACARLANAYLKECLRMGEPSGKLNQRGEARIADEIMAGNQVDAWDRMWKAGRERTATPTQEREWVAKYLNRLPGLIPPETVPSSQAVNWLRRLTEHPDEQEAFWPKRNPAYKPVETAATDKGSDSDADRNIDELLSEYERSNRS